MAGVGSYWCISVRLAECTWTAVFLVLWHHHPLLPSATNIFVVLCFGVCVVLSCEPQFVLGITTPLKVVLFVSLCLLFCVAMSTLNRASIVCALLCCCMFFHHILRCGTFASAGGYVITTGIGICIGIDLCIGIGSSNAGAIAIACACGLTFSPADHHQP